MSDKPKKPKTTKLLITLRKDYLEAIDEIVTQGGAKTRSGFIEKVIGGFLSDLHPDKPDQDSALDGLSKFFLGVLGGGAIIALLQGLFGHRA